MEERELVFYVKPSFPGFEELSAAPGARFVRCSSLTRNRPGRVLWEQVALPARAARDRLQVFHAPGYTAPLALRAPVVLLVHDLIALTHPRLCKASNRWHYRFVLPRSIRRAARIMVFSRRVREQILERFSLAEERVEVVLPGLDEGFRAAIPEQELGRVRAKYGLDGPYLLFAGNSEPKKNIARLIQAHGRALRRGSVDAALVLVGGWDAGRHAPVPDRVRPLGYVPGSDLPALYRMATALVHPALVEGFGLPIIEAMASGLPVVCSDLPALQEADPEAGIVVDPQDVDSIGEGIARVSSDEELRRDLIERGLRASRRFCWDAAARRTWGIYEEVAQA